MNDQELPVTDLLTTRRIHDAGPDFWNDLEAQLVDEPAPYVGERTNTIGRPADTITEVDMADAPAVDLASRRARRWLVAVAAAAAAVIAAVIGLSVVGDDDAPTITDDPPTPTTTAPTTTTTAAPAPEEAAPVDLPADLEWSRQTPVLDANAAVLREPTVAATDDGMYALEPSTDGSAPMLFRSPDGIAWEPLDPFVASSEFEPAALTASGPTVHIAEVSRADLLLARVRIWHSDDRAEWSSVELPTIDPRVDAQLSTSQSVMLVASPDAVVVVRQVWYDVDWWQFAPAGTVFDWDAHNDYFQGFPLPPIDADSGYAQPRIGGIAFSLLPDAPVVGWEDLPPEAEETFAFTLVNGGGRREVHVVTPDGNVEQVDGPFPSAVIGEIGWSGTRFYAWDVSGGSVALSEDGHTWAAAIELPERLARYGLNEMAGVLDETLLAWDNERNRLMFSPDLGQTFEPVAIDLPRFGEMDASGNNPEWVFLPRALSIRHGVAAGIVWRNGAPPDEIVFYLLRSTDGVRWTVDVIDMAEGTRPEHLTVTPDGSVLVYSQTGEVDIGQTVG